MCLQPRSQQWPPVCVLCLLSVISQSVIPPVSPLSCLTMLDEDTGDAWVAGAQENERNRETC